jgi:hypothetical protein
MGRTLSFEYNKAILRLQLLGDIVSYKIVFATTNIAKTAQQVALKNNLTLGSRHKKY